MKRIAKNYYYIAGAVIASLLVISILLTLFDKLSFLQNLRIVFGSIFVLFLPGFIISFIFFPTKNEKSIDIIERLTLSFALSIAIVPLVVFYLNLIGIKINLINSFFTILGIIIISLLILAYRRKR